MRFVKSLGKSLICFFLERQVKRLRSKHNFVLIAVAGSVGKTSTKLAIAKTLNSNMKVLWQEGNYNDRLTVPLIFFGQNQPGLFNIFAWCKIIIKNSTTIRKKIFGYEVVVVELGTDGPGQMAKFAYLKPDVTVITSISPEHMEYFDNLDEVAKEELSIAKFSTKVLINQDDIDKKYHQALQNYLSYGIKGGDYKIASSKSLDIEGQSAVIELSGQSLNITTQFLGEHGLKIIMPAVICAHFLGVSTDNITKSIRELMPFAGRTQILYGMHNSRIIDDSYNASPQAVQAALKLLYSLRAEQKIALLGNMNELGKFSEDEHKQIGLLCDCMELDLVVTLGPQANEFLASEAESKGCRVIRTNSPYEAGEAIKQNIKSDSIILIKGSQNGVFAEEAIKSLLVDPNDASKLVRQSEYWMKIKESQFGE